MSTFEPLPTTPESNDDAHYNKIREKHTHLIETLPKGKGWMGEHLYNYNGFWLNSVIFKANLLLHTYFKSQPSDIFLASFPKSGTTWLKALMFSTVNRHRYTFTDHPLLHHGPHSICPFLESYAYTISDYTHFPAPRILGTHYAHTLLPPCVTSCKVVYVCRDPKDVLISTWVFLSKLRSKDLAPLSLDEAFELFCEGVVDDGPFWEHVLSYWRASLDSPDKILFLKYEEMKRQPGVELRKLATFMEMPFTAEELEEGVVEKILQLCSFKNLSNLEINKKGVEKFGKLGDVENQLFFRKGQIEDWKNYLSEEMKERIDRITDERLKGSGLKLGTRV